MGFCLSVSGALLVQFNLEFTDKYSFVQLVEGVVAFGYLAATELVETVLMQPRSI